VRPHEQAQLEDNQAMRGSNMPTEQEREIRYLQEQVEYANNLEGKLDELTERVKDIEESLIKLVHQAVEGNRELINNNRELINILKTPAQTSTPSPFAEMFVDTFGTVAKKNPPRKPKAPKLSVVSAPSDEDGGPGAA
jgi:hypothetical protein